MEIKSVNLDQPYSSLDIYHSNTDKTLPGLVILPGGPKEKAIYFE